MTQHERQIMRQVNLLNLAEKLARVSSGCMYMGYAGGTSNNIRDTFDNGFEIGPQDLRRQTPNLHNHVSADVEPAV
jgi:hypothetical protein